MYIRHIKYVNKCLQIEDSECKFSFFWKLPFTSLIKIKFSLILNLMNFMTKSKKHQVISLKPFTFTVLKTCLLPCPKKFGIPEKGVSQKEEESEKLMILKGFQCRPYSSQSHVSTGFRHKTNAIFMVLSDNFQYFPLISFLKTTMLPFHMDRTSTPLLHKTVYYVPITWQCLQRYAVLQGPCDEGHDRYLQNMSSRARAERWGQRHTPLCSCRAKVCDWGIWVLSGKYIKNTQWIYNYYPIICFYNILCPFLN